MKKILEHYGTGVIAGIVAIAVMAAIFLVPVKEQYKMADVVGIFLKDNLSKKVPIIQTGTSFDRYKTHKVPVIKTKNTSGFVVGKNIAVSDFLTARDAKGNPLPIQIKGCWQEDGTSLDISRVETEGMTFSSSGVFWILAEAVDKDGFSKEVMLQILVNER